MKRDLRSVLPMLCYSSDPNRTIQGCHVDEISDKTGLDAQRLGGRHWAGCIRKADRTNRLTHHIGRCLRMLTIHHLYREVKPDVFANTRISSMLDTLKPSKDVISEYVSPMRHSVLYIVLPLLIAQSTNMTIPSVSLLLLVISMYLTRNKQWIHSNAYY